MGGVGARVCERAGNEANNMETQTQKIGAKKNLWRDMAQRIAHQIGAAFLSLWNNQGSPFSAVTKVKMASDLNKGYYLTERDLRKFTAGSRFFFAHKVKLSYKLTNPRGGQGSLTGRITGRAILRLDKR
jgi:hypothetical protein